MQNAELIKALRNCSSPWGGSCTDCPYYKDVSCKWQMMEDAADALEAADKRIAGLASCRQNMGAQHDQHTAEESSAEISAEPHRRGHIQQAHRRPILNPKEEE